ncbi:portal protein [Halorhodospira halophila]|uniref:portal protein n=1 Tax=Halorhodospira halophila TaxID=1053 RepID=UPI0019149341|nr:hypothetical protein [Halorhodospira halophila]MBK5942719.1 hypothetical protein [Halorhodospira halophila]
MPSGRGLVVVLSNDDIEQQHRSEAEARSRQESIESQLVGHIRHAWQRAHRAKQRAERRMLSNLRQRNGEYDPDKLAAIRQQGGSEIYMMLTAVKCRAAKSWIRDVLMPAGDRPWDLQPTSEPDLPPEVEQRLVERVMSDAEQAMAHGHPVAPDQIRKVTSDLRDNLREGIRKKAEKRAERMAETIEGLLDEGGWSREFDAVISDLVDFPAAILKGPVVRQQERLTWSETGDAAVYADLIPTVERVSPFDIYPAPGAEDVDDGYVIQRHRLTRSDLYGLIGVPGYDEEAIREVLREHRDGGLTEWLAQTLDDAEARANDDDTATLNEDWIDALEYWGEVPGSKLIDWGMPESEVGDPDRDVSVCAWLIGRHVIKVQLNPDPLGRKPYSKASFEKVPGSFWGRGVPDLISDCQDICNAAARAMVNNMGIASGPQVAIDVDSLPAGEDVTQIYPWKIWQMQFPTGGQGGKQVPLHFFQPNPMTDALMAVYDKYSKIADEHSGIPAYTYGSSDVGGGGRTASGLSMLMNAASKAIKNVVSHIDQGIIVPTVRRYFYWVMRYHPSSDIKGDAQVVARGAMALVAKEQLQMRRLEFLQHTANPMDSQIVGLEGRRALLARIAQDLDVPSEDVVPDQDTLEQRIQQEQQQQAQQQAQQQPAPREAELDGAPAGEMRG